MFTQYLEAVHGCSRTMEANLKMMYLTKSDKLGIKRVYSPVYTPQSNGKVEGFHRFFKACISKHIRGNQLEWDEIVPLATAAYNF